MNVFVQLLFIYIAYSTLVQIAKFLWGRWQEHRDGKPCHGRHVWAAIDIQNFETMGQPNTVLLSRCAICGQHEYQPFLGKWQLADFLKHESDIESLERMNRQ